MGKCREGLRETRGTTEHCPSHTLLSWKRRDPLQKGGTCLQDNGRCRRWGKFLDCRSESRLRSQVPGTLCLGEEQLLVCISCLVHPRKISGHFSSLNFRRILMMLALRDCQWNKRNQPLSKGWMVISAEMFIADTVKVQVSLYGSETLKSLYLDGSRFWASTSLTFSW